MILEIENEILKKCYDNKIEFISIPEGIKIIDRFAFCSCKHLKKIKFPESLEKIEGGAFLNCDFSEIELPENLKYIGSNSFGNCRKLKKISIPPKVEFIGSTIVDLMPEEVKIPFDVKEIKDNAFICDNYFMDLKYTRNHIGDIKIILYKDNIEISLMLTSNWNYKKEERLLNDFICRDSISDKKQCFAEMKKQSYKIPLAVFASVLYDDIFFKEYIKHNIKKSVKYLIDNDDTENLNKILKFGYVTSKNINEFIEYSENNVKIKNIFTNYKENLSR